MACATLESEGEAGLEFDAPVVGGATAAETAAKAAAAEAGIDAGGLAELRGVEVADISARIVVVEQVVEHHPEGEVEAMLGGLAAAKHAAAATAAAHAHGSPSATRTAHAWATATAATHAAGSHGIGGAAFRAEAEGSGEAHVEGDQAGAGEVVARHQVLGDARGRIEAEVAFGRQIRIGAGRRGEGRPCVLQRVAVDVAAQHHVVWGAGLQRHERAEPDVERHHDRAYQLEAMTALQRRASPIRS